MQFGTPYQATLSDKEQKREEKRQLREKLLKQKEEQDKADAKTFILYWFFSETVLALLLLVPLTGNSWCYKQFVGLGLKSMYIRSSLFTLDVQVVCGKNWLEDQLCKLGSSVSGSRSLQDGSAVFCGMSSSACSLLGQLYWSSVLLIFLFSLAIFLNLIGSYLLYSYWFNRPLPKLRAWALGFYGASTALPILGLIIWGFLAPDLADMPNSWNQKTAIKGTSLFSYKAIETKSPYGWCFVAAIFVLAFMVANSVAWVFFFKRHEGEDEAELEEVMEEQKLAEKQAARSTGDAAAAASSNQ